MKRASLALVVCGLISYAVALPLPAIEYPTPDAGNAETFYGYGCLLMLLHPAVCLGFPLAPIYLWVNLVILIGPFRLKHPKHSITTWLTAIGVCPIIALLTPVFVTRIHIGYCVWLLSTLLTSAGLLIRLRAAQSRSVPIGRASATAESTHDDPLQYGRK